MSTRPAVNQVEPVEPSEREAGSAIIMAMVFLVVGSILVLALANLSSTSLGTANALSSQRSLEYAADGAVDAAVEANRYLNGCAPFPNAAASVLINAVSVHVNCAVLSSSPEQRTISFRACVWASGSCGANDLLDAEVQYIDVYTSSNVVLPRRGSSVQVLQWDVKTIS